MGITFDELKALAEGGDVEAQFRLGKVYEFGNKNVNVEKDISKAIEWYEKAAENGYAQAQYYLASSYEHNRLGGFRYERAMMWYEKAAQQGFTDAQFRLAFYLEHGKIIEKDLTAAIGWYEKAAANNHAGAKLRLKIISSKNQQ